MGSVAKLDSMATIVDAEFASLGDGLRMVILTDFIRGERVGDI
jgi:hypothetical protein